MKTLRFDSAVDLSWLGLTNQKASMLKAIADKHRVLRGGALLAACSMLALACTAASLKPWPEPDMSADEAVLSAAAGGWRPQRGADADELDPLRNNAAMGDVNAGVQLMQELIDRYETGRGKDDLFEAVLWIDRFHGTESEARSGVVELVARKHCNEKALRFHWLCETAE